MVAKNGFAGMRLSLVISPQLPAPANICNSRARARAHTRAHTCAPGEIHWPEKVPGMHGASPVFSSKSIPAMTNHLLSTEWPYDKWPDKDTKLFIGAVTATATHFAPAKFDRVDSTRSFIEIACVDSNGCLVGEQRDRHFGPNIPTSQLCRPWFGCV